MVDRRRLPVEMLERQGLTVTLDGCTMARRFPPSFGRLLLVGILGSVHRVNHGREVFIYSSLSLFKCSSDRIKFYNLNAAFNILLRRFALTGTARVLI